MESSLSLRLSMEFGNIHQALLLFISNIVSRLPSSTFPPNYQASSRGIDICLVTPFILGITGSIKIQEKDRPSFDLIAVIVCIGNLSLSLSLLLDACFV